MSEERPSPFATPQTASAPEAPAAKAPWWKVSVGLLMLVFSLALLASGLATVLEDPSELGPVVIIAGTASGGLVSGWRMGGGGKAGWGWLTLVLGALLALIALLTD